VSARIVAVGELAGGRPTRLTLEIATLAAGLAAASGDRAALVLVGEGASSAAPEVAAHGVDVLVDETGDAAPVALAERLAGPVREAGATWFLLGASEAGRETAGHLVGLADLPILAAAVEVRLEDGAPRVGQAPWGGRLRTESAFTGSGGVVVVRPGSQAPVPAGAPGRIAPAPAAPAPTLPRPELLERSAGNASGPSIEEARIVVGAGRGTGGAEGVALVRALADALGGTIGATRAAVDSGWIDYALQIGQTGKQIRPELYLACGVSGAIQHAVGVRTAGTIVAIDRDADAPIGEIADLLAVGDLFAVVPALLERLERRRSS